MTSSEMQPTQHGVTQSVKDVLMTMAEAVRKGQMAKAAQIGQQSHIPLALQPSDVAIAQGMSSAKLIAQGAQGKVMQTRWQDQDVAVKVPRLGTSADLDRFRKEVSLMANLGGNSTHIMPLLGARCLPPSYFLVMPLAGPSLAHYMYVASPGWRPSWQQVVSVGIQLAKALDTLHLAGVVHRDLKPDNILVSLTDSSSSGSSPAATPHHPAPVPVLLSDLGLACHHADLEESRDVSKWTSNGRVAKPTGGFHKQDMVGTQEYCAPELLMHSAPHSPASDVFALAVTLNELTTLTPPYSDCTRDGPPGLHTVLDRGYSRQQLAAAVAGEGLRPRPPTGACPPGWIQLLDAAWANDATARPTAAQLLAQLQHLSEHVLPTWDPTIAPSVLEVHKAQAATNGTANGMEADTSAATSRPATLQPKLEQVADEDVLMGETELEKEKKPAANKECDTAAWVQRLHDAGALHIDFAANNTAASSCMDTDDSQPSTNGHADAEASHLPTVVAGIVEAVGNRDNWEDRSVVIPQLELPSNFPPASLFACFDGHRGAAAADFCARRVARLTVDTLRQAAEQQQEKTGSIHLTDQALADAMRFILLKLEQEFFDKWDGERRAAAARAVGQGNNDAPPQRLTFPGCTAVVALITGATLTVGNLGDGRAVIGGSKGSTTLALTRPHTAADESERVRLAASGTPAVWHDQGGGWRLPGSGLQVTRSIGDYDNKGLAPTPLNPVSQQPAAACAAAAAAAGSGVTAAPEVVVLQLQPHHMWLVLGSDGLWDVLPDEVVARLVADTVKHPAMCARRLAAEALDAGSNDNISALVSFLQPVNTLEKVFTATTA